MVNFIKYSSLLLLAISISCNTPATEEQPPRKQEDFKKIDFHAHYRYDREYIRPLFKKFNMQALNIDVAKEDTAQNRADWEAIKTVYNKYPDLFYLCASFESSNIDDPEFADKIIAKLEQDLADGAKLVKVWKVHGMVTKDSSGQYIQIDDERIQPIWDYLTERNVPVMAHIGEPIQAWRPLVDGKPHVSYYRDHPEYHAYNFPEMPSWETIMAARDNWIEKNPDMTIVAAHMASMSHDLNMVAERLDKYPNMVVEMGGRWANMTSQDPELVRNFFIKYQDRVIWGTDFGIKTPLNPDDPKSATESKSMIETRTELQWRYLSENDSLDYDRGSYRTMTHSLNLPDSVLRKFYYDNAMRILNNSK